ncbi:MAG: NAD-dependent epimerase/dehydratase family protein [Myxococcales bacterium]
MNIQEPVLVTGATGFIGGHLVDRLVREGLCPRILVRGNAGRVRARWGDAVDLAQGDLTDSDAVERALAGARTVFHLAAMVGDAGTLAEHRTATVEGTRHLMGAAAREKPRVVLTSSVTVYGTRVQTDVLDEDLPWGPPAGHYGACKQEQERLAVEMAQRNAIPLVVVRPGNVYGPRSAQWVEAVLVELRRRTPVLVGGGDFNAGLCHVDNLVEILLLGASRTEAIGRVYNAADGTQVTWKQYFGDLARIAGTAPPRRAPRALARALTAVIEPVWRVLRLRGRPPLTYEALNIVGSDNRIPIARVQRELGFAPVISYDEALRGIESWLRAARS